MKIRRERNDPRSCPYDLGMSRDYRRTLDDGREIVVRFDSAETGWAVWIDGEPHRWIVGWPLAPTIADLAGYDVANEDWPGWIDDWAAEIHRSTTS